VSNFKGYNLFYVNGTSYTMGGGLEDSTLSFDNEPCREGYRKIHNVSWTDTRNEVNYAARLSKMIDIQCVNEAECGGGMDRMIRMTYEFLENNWENRHNMFLFLEIADPGRSEFYYNSQKKYFICNTNLETQEFKYATPVYNPKPDYVDDLQSVFKTYHDNFHNIYEYWKTTNRNLMGLYSFCKSNEITIKFMGAPTYQFYDKFVSKSDKFLTHILHYAKTNGKLVSDDVKGYSSDGHPGYFAHIEYAYMLKEWLDENLEVGKIERQAQDDFNKTIAEMRSRDPFSYE